MAATVVFLALLVPLFWLFRARLHGVRDGTQSRLETDPEVLPVPVPYTDEIYGEDGLVYGTQMAFDASLASADRRASEMPDVNQTLQGKR